MLDKEKTGELYILKREKDRRRINPENATILISLDTDNIGQVDSLVSLDKKNISVSMMLSDKRVADFIKKNQKDLYKSLIVKEYRLVDFKCRIKDKEVDIININEIADEEIDKKINNRIDYRL